MKQFIVDRHTTPDTPTLEQVPTEKLPIYETSADADADLANLAVGQIIGIEDTGDELSHPVDVVEEDNLHAVSSNAVAKSCPRFPDYANPITIASGTTSWTATEDCYVSITQLTGSGAISIMIDGNAVGTSDTTSGYTVNSFTGYLKKGQIISFAFLSYSNIAKIFPLI